MNNGIRALFAPLNFEDKRWNDAVYSYQMAVEQALKAVSILLGIEYPKIHDIWKFYLKIN